MSHMASDFEQRLAEQTEDESGRGGIPAKPEEYGEAQDGE